MKFLSRKKSSSSIRSTATLWSNRRAGASSTSLNLTTAATTGSREEETLDSLIQASERARAASSRLAAKHGVALPPAPSTTSFSGRDKQVRSPSEKGPAPPSHLRSSPGRQRSRLAEEDDAVPSHYAEPPPEYQTWYHTEGAAFQKYRYVSKSGIRRTQLRAPPLPVPRQMDNTPATRLGTTFSNSSRPSLALPERAPTPPSPYSHSRMARSTPDLSSTPRATPVSSRSVAFSPANRDIVHSVLQIRLWDSDDQPSPLERDSQVVVRRTVRDVDAPWELGCKVDEVKGHVRFSEDEGAFCGQEALQEGWRWLEIMLFVAMVRRTFPFNKYFHNADMQSSSSANTENPFTRPLEPGSDNTPSKIKVATGPPQNSSVLVGPPLSRREKGGNENGSTVNDSKPSEEQQTQEEPDYPPIPRELEEVSRQTEAGLKDAIRNFMAKGHAALKPDVKDPSRG
ncbi:hypothetical protein FA13DRAFT_1715596 [Coprinellus micaceus]|uniref:Uncharacterized protein n=1 Tax=Coprinellus micaceus TaxID=71717 RepID=A0A4Y7SN18_COPMI|nr:hypothetical protein FA13DRAFT_1715596 [Coprinellus micaceus]